jgi:hypothetical protein
MSKIMYYFLLALFPVLFLTGCCWMFGKKNCGSCCKKVCGMVSKEKDIVILEENESLDRAEQQDLGEVDEEIIISDK